MNDNEARQAKLEERLQEGFWKIGQKLNEGVKVENWCTHWETLLREYEAISDVLAAAPLAQVEMELGVRREEAA